MDTSELFIYIITFCLSAIPFALLLGALFRSK